jgi:hypothetical protein
MKNRTVNVLRHGVTELADVNSYLGIGESETETIATVVSGPVSGELDRVVSRDEVGALVAHYQARIDGLNDGTGIAKVESDSAEELRCLALVADFLADESDRLRARDLDAP